MKSFLIHSVALAALLATSPAMADAKPDASGPSDEGTIDEQHRKAHDGRRHRREDGGHGEGERLAEPSSHESTRSRGNFPVP